MKHEVKTRYPATPAVVMKMFTDKEFHTRRLEATGIREYTVIEQHSDAKQFRIKIERIVPIQAPAMLKKLVPVAPKVTSAESWDITKKTGHVDVDAHGMPVEMSCDITLAADGKECIAIYAWTVRAKVPLMGGVIEKFVAADIDKRAAEEWRAAVEQLDAYRS